MTTTMKKAVSTPTQITEALAMREVGYIVFSISQRLGISVRTLQRHFAERGVKKGGIKEEVLAQARADLMKRVTSDDAIKEEAARLINDDLAHARFLREVMIDAAEQLQATSLKEAVLVMRAAAAYSTTIKNTSDMMRHSLLIKELTSGEIEEMRRVGVDEEVVLLA